MCILLAVALSATTVLLAVMAAVPDRAGKAIAITISGLTCFIWAKGALLTWNYGAITGVPISMGQ